MKKNFQNIAIGLAAVAMLAAGCAKDDVGGITVSTGSTTELYSVTNQSTTIVFNASSNWTASCSADWLTFSPTEGEAGKNTITVSTTSTNRTKQARTALMTIRSDGKKETVTIRQREEYGLFEVKEITLPAEGGELMFSFTTNMEKDDIELWYTRTLESWIDTTDTESARTRAEQSFSLQKPLKILPNPGRDVREGSFFLMMKDKQGNPMGLDTLWVRQEGVNDGYVSTDYSENGRYELINEATKGKGIPIVVMGDGFQDREISDGTYAAVMHQAMENMFSEEPVKSLREYFNVYAVTTVSKHNQFGDNYETALNSQPDHQTMAISASLPTVMDYVKKVEGIDSLNTLAVVILNTNLHRGVTYMFSSSNKEKEYNYAIALCPVIDSLKSELFREVLTHEAIGHGFGKLADEYVRSTEGSATEREIKWLKEYHEEGKYLNVDSEKDSTKVLWSRMITDPEFANEKIGVYEGGYTFYKGIYRPSQESMMRSNDAPFNAPSRQAIYNKVMERGLGKTPTYEEFVAFDQEHKPAVWTYRSRTRQGNEDTWHPAPPRIIRRTW